MSEEENFWKKSMRRRVSRRQMLRGAGLAGLGLAGAGILGCNQQQKAEPTPSAAAVPTKAAGGATVAPAATTAPAKMAPKGKITAVLATMGPMLTDPCWGPVDGNLSPIAYELHDYLVARDVDGKLVPSLASSYKSSDDGLSWEFTLRKGIKFHNGDPVTPADFKYTYERNWRPRFKNTFLSTYEKIIEGIEAVGDDKVVFHTKGPQPMFLLQAPLYVVPQKYIEQVGDEAYENKPVGTGPYKLVNLAKGEYLEYEAFEDYWNPVNYPKVKSMILKVVPEPATRVAMLQTGDADIVVGVGGPQIQQVQGFTGCRTIAAEKTGSTLLNFLKMNDPNSPYSKLQVRQALSYAIDRDAIAKKIYYGEAFPLAIGGITSLAFGNDPSLKPYPYDPEKAKKLLADAGYPNGFEAEIVTYDTATMANTPDQMQAIAGFFEKIGVKTKVTLMDTGTYTAKYRDKTLPGDMAPITMPTSSGWDVDYTLAIFYTSTAPYSSLKSADLDKMYAESMTIVDTAKREALLKTIVKMIYDQVYGLGTVEANSLYAVGPKVKDWKVQKGMPYLTGLERVILKD